jgi:hypothetical protein
LIAVKAPNVSDGLDLVSDAHKLHLRSKPECQAYYDALPTLRETMDAIKKIQQDRHAAHACTPGVCECKCGCSYEVKCTDDLDNDLCWTCALRVMRDDDEHGYKDESIVFEYKGRAYNRPLGRGVCLYEPDGTMSDLQLEDRLPEGEIEIEIVVRRAPPVGGSVEEQS